MWEGSETTRVPLSHDISLWNSRWGSPVNVRVTSRACQATVEP